MSIKEFIPPDAPVGADGIRDIFTLTEALSGSRFNDNLHGDNTTRAAIIPLAKNQLDNPNLIKGLADGPFVPVIVGGTSEGSFFAPGAGVGFAGGNIILGGAGNDTIAAGDGNDIIDGDASLHVELLKNSFGVIGAGSQILREIRFDETVGNVDTAVFTGNRSGYRISGPDGQDFTTVAQTPVNVAGGGGLKIAPDGTDRIRNVERVQFLDGTFAIDKLSNLFDGNGTLIQRVGGGGGGGGGGVGISFTGNQVPLGAVTDSLGGLAPKVGTTIVANLSTLGHLQR